ncbi:MAG: substrate-binding domain-containing protein [Bacteroidales bacterium]|nr:substrate-binding domain-containing protein [Bacteroidales bacterium]
MFSRKARLKDIAALTGVSIGTVDRVLHDRGQVAEKTREKVLRAAKELNYSPNIIARALKTRKGFNIISLLPFPTDENSFWEKHPEGMEKAMLELDQFPVSLRQYTFDLNNEKSFQKKAAEVMRQNFDGIVLAPVFKNESITFCSLLRKKKIPFVFVDNFLTETNFLAYIGENIFGSGRVAGQLADLVTPGNKDILVINIAKNLRNMHHLNKRTDGFISYLADKSYRKRKTLKLNIPGTDKQVVKKSLEKVFMKYPDIATIFVTGSKSYKIAENAYGFGNDGVNIIGYDLLENNVECLKEGKIKFLIGQRPEEQTYRAIKKLFEYLSLKKVPDKLDYLPVDIVTSENVDFFINSH